MTYLHNAMMAMRKGSFTKSRPIGAGGDNKNYETFRAIFGAPKG